MMTLMNIVNNPFPVFTTATELHRRNPLIRLKNTSTNVRVAVEPPPPDFDFRTEILDGSRTDIAGTHPVLLDLADNGSLVLIEKNQYEPVPPWRTEFVERDAIWLIGTTHISQDSAVHVDRVIRAVKPDNVVVELCRSRAGIMYASTDNQELRSSMFSLSGNGFFGAAGRSIDLGGFVNLVLFVIALFQLERAWNSLKWKEKLSLLSSVIVGITHSSYLSTKKTLITESSASDSNFQLYERLSFSYPSLLLPPIHERDTYLAWSLKRSKAMNGSQQVVGVIGKGHMNGVIYSLGSDQGNLRFRDLAGKRNSGEVSSWAVSTFRNEEKKPPFHHHLLMVQKKLQYSGCKHHHPLLCLTVLKMKNIAIVSCLVQYLFLPTTSLSCSKAANVLDGHFWIKLEISISCNALASKAN